MLRVSWKENQCIYKFNNKTNSAKRNLISNVRTTHVDFLRRFTRKRKLDHCYGDYSKSSVKRRGRRQKNVNPTLLGRGTAEMCVDKRDRERWNITTSYNCTTDTATEEGEEEES